MEGFGRMAYSDLDDVDYLVEDNVMDEFAYHRKWKTLKELFFSKVEQLRINPRKET